MAKTITIQIISALLILLFTYSAINKLIDHTDFINTLQTAAFFGNEYKLISWAVPITELGVVLLLIFQRTRIYGYYASVAILYTFTFYIAWMLLYTNNLPCSCGGVLSALTWPQHLLFNIIFLLLSAIGILVLRKQNHHKSQSPPTSRPGPTLSETKSQTFET